MWGRQEGCAAMWRKVARRLNKSLLWEKKKSGVKWWLILRGRSACPWSSGQAPPMHRAVTKSPSSSTRPHPALYSECFLVLISFSPFLFILVGETCWTNEVPIVTVFFFLLLIFFSRSFIAMLWGQTSPIKNLQTLFGFSWKHYFIIVYQDFDHPGAATPNLSTVQSKYMLIQ